MNKSLPLAPILRRSARIALVLGMVGLLILAWQSGLTEQMRDPAHFAGRGGTAILLFLAGFIVLGALGIPPALMILPLTAVWAWPIALGIAFGGGFGASLLGFLLSRYLARDFLDARIPDSVRRCEHRLEVHGFSTVLVLRILLFLFPPVNWLLGLSHIPVGTFVVGTLVGMIPGVLVLVFTGSGLVPFLAGQPPPIIGGALVVAASGILLWWRYVMRPLHRRMLDGRNEDGNP